MNQFDLKPEEVDTIIKSRLAQFTRKGGKGGRLVKWTDEELELRDSVIISYLTENALSRERTAQQIASRWDVELDTARGYVREAIKRFGERYAEENEAEQKRMFLETLENLITDSIAQGQKDSALRALDMISKVKGFYVNKQEVNLQATGKMSFTFGEKDTDNGD